MQITLELFQVFDLMAFTTAFILGLVFLFKEPKTNIYLGAFLISLGFEVFQALFFKRVFSIFSIHLF